MFCLRLKVLQGLVRAVNGVNASDVEGWTLS